MDLKDRLAPDPAAVRAAVDAARAAADAKTAAPQVAA